MRIVHLGLQNQFSWGIFSLSFIYLTKLCNELLIFFWLDQDNKELKEWWWPDELIFANTFFYVIRCCRGSVHNHAKLTWEDDYYNMVKVILCSILFHFLFKSSNLCFVLRRLFYFIFLTFYLLVYKTSHAIGFFYRSRNNPASFVNWHNFTQSSILHCEKKNCW